MGAVLAPRYNGKWIGNWDLTVKFMQEFKNGYPGACTDRRDNWTFVSQVGFVEDSLWIVIRECGTAVNTRVVWVDSLFTIDPENIKVGLIISFLSIH